MKYFSKTTLTCTLIIWVLFSSGQKNPEAYQVKCGALTQMHVSYAQSDSNENPYGFRLRRLDFKVWQAPNDKISWSLLMGFSDFKFQILELDFNYKFSKALKLRLGHFAPPAVRSAAPVDNLYKVPIMAFIERPPITILWSDFSNLHAYRTMGVQVHGNFIHEKVYYALMIGNPKGSQFFNASSKTPYNYNSENGLSYWSRIEYQIAPNFVAGCFYNIANSKQDSLTINRTSYGGHILHRINNTYFMFEYIQGENRYNQLKTAHYRGYFGEVSYRYKKIEPAIRFDQYEPNIRAADSFAVRKYNNYTIGLNIYPITKVKIQVNYIFKDEQMNAGIKPLKNNLAYINFQYLL